MTRHASLEASASMLPLEGGEDGQLATQCPSWLLSATERSPSLSHDLAATDAVDGGGSTSRAQQLEKENARLRAEIAELKAGGALRTTQDV